MGIHGNLPVLLHPQGAPRGPQQPQGCQGDSPGGERCRLCQVSRHWHKGHTWSGITCPEPGTGAIRASSPGCPQHPGAAGLRSLLAALCRFSCPGPGKDLGPAASGAAAEPWKSRAAAPRPSLSCHALVPFPGKQIKKKVPLLDRDRS